RAELNNWARMLDGSDSAQHAVAAGIAGSLEAREHLVRTWYVTYLGRQAIGGEESGWVNLLAGTTEEQGLSGLLASQEFYDRAQTLITSGTADERYVQALYRVLLGRAASGGEVAASVPLLAEGRQALALRFLTGQLPPSFPMGNSPAEFRY